MQKAIKNNEYIRNKKRVFDILRDKTFDLVFVHKDTMYHYVFLINDTTFNYSEGLGHEPMTEENKRKNLSIHDKSFLFLYIKVVIYRGLQVDKLIIKGKL